MTAKVLSRRSLGRATLARQLLLERAPLAPLDAIRHLVGLQAQTAHSWYLTLWSRLANFDPVAVGRLLEERQVVRLTVMRQTIHLVTADDALLLRAFTQPTIDRSLRGKWLRNLAGIHIDELAVLVRAFVAEKPRTPTELAAHLDARWPGRDRQTMVNAMRAVVPLLQVPPHGVWRRPGAVKLAALDAWLGRKVPRQVDPAPILLRYLGAFGPASVADAQAWSGVTRLREVFERLRPRLRTFRDEAGRELFDLPDAPRPEPDTPAPVRFLADFDNALLSHADRTRFIGEVERRLFAYQNGPFPGALLLDGTVVGQWFVRRTPEAATLVMRLARQLSAEDEQAVRAEAAAVLEFSYTDAGDHRFELLLLAR